MMKNYTTTQLSKRLLKYVTLADRLHNIRTLNYRPLEKQIQVAQETLDFYLPLAERAGMHRIAQEIKKLCEKILKQKV